MENDGSHKILVIRMELQRLVSEFARLKNIPFSDVTPWNCEDAKVREKWMDLTSPENFASLEEWLKAEKANLSRSLWTEEAIRTCRNRVA
jgi:hypothetical protein